MRKIQVRLGVEIEASDKEAEAIVNGDADVLAEVIRKNGFALKGNSCVPAGANKALRLEEDVEFEIN